MLDQFMLHEKKEAVCCDDFRYLLQLFSFHLLVKKFVLFVYKFAVLTLFL